MAISRNVIFFSSLPSCLPSPKDFFFSFWLQCSVPSPLPASGESGLTCFPPAERSPFSPFSRVTSPQPAWCSNGVSSWLTACCSGHWCWELKEAQYLPAAGGGPQGEESQRCRQALTRAQLPKMSEPLKGNNCCGPEICLFGILIILSWLL